MKADKSPDTRAVGRPPAQAQWEEKGGWARWALLALGTALLVCVPYNLSKANWADAAAGFVGGGIAVGAFAYIVQSRRRRLRFLDWLTTHREEIIAGTASYDGNRIGIDTKVRRFETAVSLLIISSRSRRASSSRTTRPAGAQGSCPLS